MITTKTRIAIIENNSAFQKLIKGMLFKVGMLSQFHFSSVEKFKEQVEKGSMQFDFVLLNCTHSERDLMDLIKKKKMGHLGYGERTLMTPEMINLMGLNHLVELPFTSEKLFQKIQSADI